MYLNCKTYFSFRYGTIATETLVDEAVAAGITALALTNINGMADSWTFYDHCRQKGIKPILGTEIRNGDQLCFVLLAANARGLEWINEWLSRHAENNLPFPERTTGKPFFHDAGDGFVIFPFTGKPPAFLHANERIGICMDQVAKLFSFTPGTWADRLVVLQPVSFLNRFHFNMHRLLRAVDHNTLLSKLGAGQQGSEAEIFPSPSAIREAFSQYPQILQQTQYVIDACAIEMELQTDKNRKCFTTSAADDRVLLKKLALDGCVQRYGAKNRLAPDRVRKELGIIDRMGFNAYFLIAWDIVRYAQSRGYYYVGRGSGANSIVAFCLQITDVDPIELDLYFERFLNPHRLSPPDFDIDFSWADRDDVIDYIFKRYGKSHVALLGMVTTFQYNALMRELGKVFGLPKHEIDRLAVKGYYSRNSRFHPEKAEDRIQQLMIRYGEAMVNYPNFLSIHPGGILISEEPIYRYTPVFLPPKGFPTAQLDMFVAEKIGLFKLDILSQRGLGHIKETLAIVRRNRGIRINIHDIEAFKKDPLLKKQIRDVDTIGCFYIESPAMRQLLKKLECDDYITLVAASSIIRPGVASSGMMKTYIQRFHAPDAFDYIHPVMKELLEETYGVMVYQEDVIKVAHHFAGLDMGEADILRRAMSGKYRGSQEMERLREKFYSNCRERGYDEAIIKEVWRQIESFGGYSFSKAHSASFAVESYQSLYLKTYYPMEFMVAVINNFGGFYSRELYFYELSKTGARIHPPCVNTSEWMTCIIGKEVYAGFVHVKSLEQTIAETIVSEREQNGRYTSLEDFVKRTGIGKEQLNMLIRLDALRFTGMTKKQLLWEANLFTRPAAVKARHRDGALFEEPPLHYTLPDLPEYPLEVYYDEIELLGFPLRNPFPMADDDLAQYLPVTKMQHHVGDTVTMIGYLITYKSVMTVKGETMCFGTFLDAQLDWLDTVHFPDSLKRHPLSANGFYRLTGRVVAEFGVHNLEVHHMAKIGLKDRKQ
ncbi:DNA polymerase III subunit alpha [Flavihumibacter petaseus]|uniref:DNA-directed DNA polymerase n=1 Tax=Flavihumibacter petaseus NBRC 106054 TaxID=1220578 RepID=A0A0E9MZG3_9BACT|nr:DNA polymerase III subunit alpha [Flavihumibacter petaseus]GAO42903.1 DNA polymerase III alpha subunit [Flavihumibacter petaseus NBRC 106054]